MMKIYWALILILLFSCTNLEKKNNISLFSSSIINYGLSPSTYVKWVETADNGLKVQKEIDDLLFTAQYKPYEYIVYKEEKIDTLTTEQLYKKISSINGLQYFNFQIESLTENEEVLKHNMKSYDEYEGRVKYFSFQMQKDFKLIEGGDTLDCVLFHFERNFGIAPYCTFILGFPLSSKSEKNFDKTILYDDKFFNVGKIYLTIDSENLSQIPKLKSI